MCIRGRFHNTQHVLVLSVSFVLWLHVGCIMTHSLNYSVSFYCVRKTPGIECFGNLHFVYGSLYIVGLK